MQKQHKNNPFPHHRLRVYWRALELARLVKRWPIRRTCLRRQVERAVDSVVLTVYSRPTPTRAEGAGVVNGRNKAQFMIARGSALEVVAAYELAAAYGQVVPLEEVLEQANVIVAMLTKLGR